MQLRDALDDFKRHRDDPTLFPGESRSTAGRFSGRDDRLVHVQPDGSLTDYGYPLTGHTGIQRSRLGLRTGEDVHWFDEREPAGQSYHADTGLVVTEHVTPRGRITQYDLTVEDAHVTHFDCTALDADGRGREAGDVDLVAFVGFAPDGRDTRIAQLHHEKAVECYHREERDFFASATGFDRVHGQVPPRFAEVLAADPVDLPRSPADGRYEEDQLSGNVVAYVPVESGTATLATLLTDAAATDRERALARLDDLTSRYADPASLRTAAEDQVSVAPADDHPHADAVAADLRVLDLLSGETGLRIAGPDFDPFYAYSGGYGYTWFRDDAEIARFLLESADRLGADLDDWHARSARAYAATQHEDGSWPHRVWPSDRSLAPGWANGRLEAGDDVDYQADQTGSVVAFLGAYADRTDEADVAETLADAVASLDDTLEADGRPEACQNAWEDETGRFAHTAATFLGAYARVATSTGVDSTLTEYAASRAREIYAALDDLWLDDDGVYAVREYDEDGRHVLDGRCDSSTLALVAAHRAFDRVDSLDDDRLDRLASHVAATVDALHRDPDGDAEGLVRYEGDGWRRREQAGEKVWSVSTAWGAHASAGLAILLDEHDHDRAGEFAALARDLLALVLPGGPLCMDTGYLPEQVFDDGTPDSATPLGWPHAIRLATVALIEDHDVFAEPEALAEK